MKGTPPRVGFLFRHPAHLIACGFGSGLAPVAPGTFGTLFGWGSFLLIAPWFGDGSLLLIITGAFLGGIVACEIAGRALGVVDHGSIVWDEVVPFWLVLALTPRTWAWQLAAFLLFRLFDITKPPPARFFDTRIKNGFGVMMDDLVAAGYTLLALAIGKRVLEAWGA